MLAYVLASLVVAAFLQGYEVWTGLSALLGREAGGLAPILAAVLVPLAGVLAVLARHRRLRADQWLSLAGCLALTGAGILACDASFPAKRSHVVEYLLVALLVRKGASRHAQGWPLVLTTVVIAGLMGVHDELVQGLHPKRTFGLADIGVDLLAVMAGALLGHGLGLFTRQNAEPCSCPPGGLWALAAGMLGLGVCLMVGGLWLTGIRLPDLAVAAPPPLWSAAPLIGGGIALLLADWPDSAWLRHVLEASLILTLIMPFHLMVPHVSSLVFR